MTTQLHEMYELSIKNELEKFKTRINNIEKNLAKLQKIDSNYAAAHRALISVYTDIAAILNRAKENIK